MKRKLCCALMLLVTASAYSQVKQSHVIAAAGGFAEDKTAAISVSFTVGEPVVGTFSTNDFIVVNGFQQSYTLLPVGINDAEAAELSGVTIYPNPVKTEFFVELAESATESVVVKCFDMSGRLVVTEQFDQDASFVINVAALPKGVYFVRVDVDGMMITNKKIIKL